MRITGGKYCRRIVKCPEGEIRPAMDMMRESMFSILGSLDGIYFLDLYSGSGCIAIEAASRGAKVIYLVENDSGKKKTIEENLSYVEEEKHLYIMNTESFLSFDTHSFDIVYADPPFKMKNKESIIKDVVQYKKVKDDGLFIIHIPSEEDKLWQDEYENFSLSDKRKYGRSILRFYKYNKRINYL